MNANAVCPACQAVDYGYTECRSCGLALRDANLPSAGTARPEGAEIGPRESHPDKPGLERREQSMFALAAANPDTPEYAIRAGYWCAALTIVFPILVLPGLAFGFLAAQRGQLAAGIVVMVASGVALWLSTAIVLAVTGG